MTEYLNKQAILIKKIKHHVGGEIVVTRMYENLQYYKYNITKLCYKREG